MTVLRQHCALETLRAEEGPGFATGYSQHEAVFQGAQRLYDPDWHCSGGPCLDITAAGFCWWEHQCQPDLIYQHTFESPVRTPQVNQWLTPDNTEGRGSATWFCIWFGNDLSSAKGAQTRSRTWMLEPSKGEKEKKVITLQQVSHQLRCWHLSCHSSSPSMPIWGTLQYTNNDFSAQSRAAWHLSDFQHVTEHLWGSSSPLRAVVTTAKRPEQKNYEQKKLLVTSYLVFAPEIRQPERNTHVYYQGNHKRP